jgi:predicted O-linked N-acetylglucosamine transferase (SPINDLY family)
MNRAQRRIEAANGAAGSVGGLFADALQMQRAGRLNEALPLYQRVLERDPNHADSLHRLGEIAHRAGRHDLAVELVEKAIAVDPQAARFHATLGEALAAQGKPGDAVAAFRRAIALDPDVAATHTNLGAALRELGQFEESATACRRAIALDPNLAPAHSDLGAALFYLGRLDESESCLRRALGLNPDFAVAYCNLGNVLQGLLRYEEAIACYSRALTLRPDLFAVLRNLGVAFHRLGLLDDAVACFRQSLALTPADSKTHNNLGGALRDLGKLDEATAAYRHAYAIDRHNSNAHSNCLFCLNYAPDLPAEEIFAEYQRWDEAHARPLAPAAARHDNDRSPERRLRIGYVSADFRHHPARYFIEPVLASYDKSKVEVFAYAEVAREDVVSARFKSYVDHWRPTVGLSGEEMAERIRADRIDVLVDLAGHTAGHRLLVFARKPAPVQVSWLGYGYTTGLKSIDYFLADPQFAPPGCEHLFSEKLARLPVFAAYRPAEGMGSPETARRPRSTVTFGTLTRTVRINHHVVRSWAAILSATPGSQLVLNSGNFRTASFCDDLANKFAAHGIARERLLMSYDSPPWDVLRSIDVGLDCFPHNSGTTLIEGLYLGVPFVTLAGRPSVGRVGAAILTALGRPEWIASTDDEYVAKAVALARDPARLIAMRPELRAQMEASPLMDEAGFAGALERAYRAMWRRWCDGQSPEALSIPA